MGFDCRDAKVKVVPLSSTAYGPVTPMQPGETINLSQPNNEKLLMSGYADEQAKIAGTPIDYWGLVVQDSIKDPLYGEPKERVWDGPYRIWGIFTAPESLPETKEAGVNNLFPTTASIPRAAFEAAGMQHPGEGDVLHVWDLPLYMHIATMEPEPPPGAGYFFDVVNADPDGYVVDSPIFATWKITLKRRTEFTPERRLQRP